MKTKVIRRDGETAVVIPHELAIATALPDEVYVHTRGGDLVISRSEDDLSLDELLDRVTEKNKHELLDWGPAAGHEVS
jgi:antitoxin component of MazEF toxin-antitoxin module